MGFKKWASFDAVSKHRVWMVPVNFAEHWSVLVLLPRETVIVHYDSLNRKLTTRILNGLCTFMEKHLQESLWDQWTLHQPKDVPSQKRKGIVGGNCGVHVCTWVYIIAAGCYTTFTQQNMDAARRGIATFLFEKSSRKFKGTEHVQSRNALYNATIKEGME